MVWSVTLRSLYALVSHLCLTGLSEVALPYSDMWQDCQSTLQHTRPCYAKSSYRLVDPETLHGNVHQVDHVPNGPTNSAAITTMFPLRLRGGKLLVAVTRERRYGPSRQRVNDDDDMVLWKETAFPLCTAMKRCWKRNVFLLSSVIVVIHLPISCVSSMAISCHVPAVSMANG